MPPDDPFGDALVRWFIRAALVAYAAALFMMCRLSGPKDWSAQTTGGRFARGFWLLAYLLYVIHVALAFHYYHRWSHAHAVAHTEAISGWGEGIYASHSFTLLWGLDSLMWLFWPERYALRSPWIDRFLHGFMLFIVFNGTVVFEEGVIRWFGVVMFVGLAAWWVVTRQRKATV